MREAENETLLKEVHHRVKNNLQAMWGMIQVERSHVTDPNLRHRLSLVGDRISVLGRIHEQLYSSDNLAFVDMADTIRELSGNLADAYGRPSIEVRVDAEEVLLDLETALPVGLLVNELIANSFKHAFPDGREGRILVSLHHKSAEQVLLSVSDDGMGVGVEGVPNRPGIGLTLAMALVSQIEGTIDFRSDIGYSVTVLFPSS